MTRAAKKAKPDLDPPVIPVAYIERFLTKHKIRMEQVENGQPVWMTAEGPVPLTIPDIERLISREDPVIWAFLNLTEAKSIPSEAELGKWVTRAGDPWKLWPVQAKMARIAGNLIVECGSEVGKTRDVILGSSRDADLAIGGGSSMIAADSDITLLQIWAELEFQLEKNKNIGGGVVDRQIKPFPVFKFANDYEIIGRICGHNGKQFRGAHISGAIRADEVAMWKNPTQFSELFRAALPGCAIRLYSTPDGDYSSPFFGFCDRAVSVDATKEAFVATGEAEDVRFRKINIRKSDAPSPFWSEKRQAFYRELYGGEQSVRYITNVNGGWGSPSYSVFPTHLLEPNLSGGRTLPWYRIVAATMDHEASELGLVAACLDPASETEEGVNLEQIIGREKFPLMEADQIAREIAKWYPGSLTGDWVDPELYCGVDAGSSEDPTELVVARVIGRVWQDVFRLHLRSATWPQQAEILAALDHASGHRVRYSIDSGSAGSALVQTLTETPRFRRCPETRCGSLVHFGERLEGRNFGAAVDEIDIETGEPLLNPDRKDGSGNLMPFRVSNKEFGTRILERKMQKRELQIADDGGAGTQKLSGAQLLVNHTETGRNAANGSRKFKGIDDHLVDARRQLALVIVGWTFDGMRVSPTLRNSPSAGPRQSMTAFAGPGIRRVAAGGVASGMGAAFGGGNLRGGVF